MVNAAKCKKLLIEWRDQMRPYCCLLMFLVGSTSATMADAANEKLLLQLSGSNTIGAALAPRLAEAWLVSLGAGSVSIEQRRQNGQRIPEMVVHGQLQSQAVDVVIRAYGSADAFTHLREGSTDIGMSSRLIKPEEKTILADLGDMQAADNEHVIALDGIAVIVAPGNRLQKISRLDLKRIFSGEVSDWSQIGAGAGAIHVYTRDDKSGTYDTFKHLVLGDGNMVSSAQRFEDSTALEQAVSNDPGAIGFVALPFVRNSHALAVSDGKKALALSPTIFTIKKEDYVLSRRLFLYTAATPANPYVRQFVRFVQSEAGQQVVKEVGFVDQNLNLLEARQLQAQTGKRVCTLSSQWPGSPKDYCRLVEGKTDLGTSFRFRTRSMELDNRAVQDLQRLLKLVADHENSVLTLIGFADARGGYENNRALSEGRAAAVKAALRTLGINRVEIAAFGAEIPVADNETEDGRDRNRRVEVWATKSLTNSAVSPANVALQPAPEISKALPESARPGVQVSANRSIEESLQIPQGISFKLQDVMRDEGLDTR